jgi:anti-sigma regulatory factor (Ser/Thr protein kinase)
VIERRTAVRSDAANLPALMIFLQDFWRSAELPPALAPTFELALEEVFLNVVQHGSPAGTEPQIDVALAVAGADLVMTVEDNGPPFDPLSLPAPDVTAGLAERPVGGLGVFLVRQMMDDVTYHRVDSRNQLRMLKHVPS